MRTVKRSHPAYRDDIADLITRRPIPGPEIDQIDPFLFLNHHGRMVYKPGNNGLPFGPHPHRGFETVTFILEGSLAHHDTGGHESVIEAGGVQWMTAGSGLIHSEISPPSFKRTGGALEILQLWVNLPSHLKMSPPRYSGVQKKQIPHLSLAGGKGSLELIAGEFSGVHGPITSLTGVFMSVVRLSAGAKVTISAPCTRSVFLYVIGGRVAVSGKTVGQWHLVEMNSDGDEIEIEASASTVLLFGHATPINESVVAQGPFVMNSKEEIRQAFADYKAGKFNGANKLLEIGD
ncbi:pirin family protein [Pseudomonas sp. CFBP 13602]|uniref:pirin family protein n=1 Tax=Pseudomonas sp. CFBP 13602 TaxID=2774039 RepID=UPI001783BB22|nr:pirin family protein [Pseudomonas sp. CFBP 13602]